MIEHTLVSALDGAANSWCAQHGLATTYSDITLLVPPVRLSVDYASAIALQLSARCKTDPLVTAGEFSSLLLTALPSNFAEVTVTAPGFLNFAITTRALADALSNVFKVCSLADGFPLDAARRSSSALQRKLSSIIIAATEPRLDSHNVAQLPAIIDDATSLLAELGDDARSLQLLVEDKDVVQLRAVIMALSDAIFSITHNSPDLRDKSYALYTRVDGVLRGSAIISPTRGVTLLRLAICYASLHILATAQTMPPTADQTFV